MDVKAVFDSLYFCIAEYETESGGDSNSERWDILQRRHASIVLLREDQDCPACLNVRLSVCLSLLLCLSGSLHFKQHNIQLTSHSWWALDQNVAVLWPVVVQFAQEVKMNADFNRTVQDMRRFSVATSFFLCNRQIIQ